MYRACWTIKSFFRWIKHNLNMPVLFGMTENTIYNQLFAALIAYVMLKWLYKMTKGAYLSANIIAGCFSENASDRDAAAGMAGGNVFISA
jgi:Gpi18-like mannosyltransferase